MSVCANNLRGLIMSHWITSLRSCVSVAIGTCITAMLIGCAPIGHMISDPGQTYTGRDSLILQAPEPNILHTVGEVGKSLGYKVSGLDKERGTIRLTSTSPLFVSVMVGKSSSATLSISIKDSGKKLDIGVVAYGNFGAADQENVMALVSDFKAKLLEKIGQ